MTLLFALQNLNLGRINAAQEDGSQVGGSVQGKIFQSRMLCSKVILTIVHRLLVHCKSEVQQIEGQEQQQNEGQENPSAAEETWSVLPADLQMQILSWLPAEDVIQLRTVSKQWASLLRHPRLFQLWSENRRAPSLYVLRSIQKTAPTKTHYYKYGPDARGSLQPVPVHWRSRFTPEYSYPYLSAGGLVLSVNKTNFWVGNPLTNRWVKVPPVNVNTYFMKSQLLIPYVSEGQTYFKIWIEPYLFDSKLGIWTLPEYKTIWMFSFNTVCIGGVNYGLGFCWQHFALVLLKIDDFGALSDSAWVYAWELSSFRFSCSYLVEAGGEIGMITREGEESVFLLLDRNSSKGWSWKRVSVLPDIQIDAFIALGSCRTHGNLTFMVVYDGIVVFNSQTLTWAWIEAVKKEDWLYVESVVWEADLTVVPSLNTPSDEVRRTCASKYKSGFLNPTSQGCFSDLEAFTKRGMSWEEIGRVSVDPSKGWNFVGKLIGEDEVVENVLPRYREKDIQILKSAAQVRFSGT